jgi:hypothetical protein
LKPEDAAATEVDTDSDSDDSSTGDEDITFGTKRHRRSGSEKGGEAGPGVRTDTGQTGGGMNVDQTG